VVINGPNVTARTLTKYWRILGNVKITATDVGFGGASTDYWVHDGITLAGPGSGEPFSTGNNAAVAWQNCTVSGYTALGESGGPSNDPVLWRNTTFDNSGGTSNAIQFTNSRCFIFNKYKGSAAETQVFFHNTTDNFIIAYNQFFNAHAQWFESSKATMNNIAAVGNLYEYVGTTGAVWDVDSSSGAYANFIYWHNTVAGDRVNIENDISNNPPNNELLVGFSFKNNSNNFHAYKGDYFNFKNNSVLMQNAQNQTGFSTEDCGLGMAHNNEEKLSGNFPTRSGGIDYTRATAAGYTTDNSSFGANTGNGNYLPAAGSTLLNRFTASEYVIPFDLLGNPMNGAIGAIQPLAPIPPATTHGMNMPMLESCLD
jgi:hypothetical protein